MDKDNIFSTNCFLIKDGGLPKAVYQYRAVQIL